MNVEDVVRDALGREDQDVDAVPVPWAGLQRRATRVRRARLAAGGLAVVAVAVALVASTVHVEGDERVDVTSGTEQRVPAEPVQPSPTTVADPPSTLAPATTTTTPAGPATTTTTAPTTTTTTTAAAPATTTTTTASPDPVCTAPEGGVDPPPTQADLEARLAQAWRLCAAPSVFGTREAGLELRPDHRWSKLDRAADGRWVRLSGWGNEGTWSTVDTSAMNGTTSWQLDLVVDGGGTVPSLVVFARAVSKMRLTSTGVYVADYAALPAGSVTG